VRADALTLYGFSTGTEKRAFDLLMSVQHVGPKLALTILSVLAPEELVAVIDYHSLGVKLVGDTPVAVAWELGTQRLNGSRSSESCC
jgi:hypothetical protein